MAGFRKDMKRLERAALAAGWRVDRTTAGHWRFYPPDGVTPPAVISGTPSDVRAWRNFTADLRRKGLDV